MLGETKKADYTFDGVYFENMERTGENVTMGSIMKFGRLHTEFFKKVRAGYRQIVEQNPDRCIEINAEQTPDNVYKEIYQIILKRFEKELICS